MPDDMDLCQQINQELIDDALADHYRRLSPVGAIHELPLHCQDCGDDIPEKRRQAVPGCRRCIDCQTIFENWRPL